VEGTQPEHAAAASLCQLNVTANKFRYISPADKIVKETVWYSHIVVAKSASLRFRRFTVKTAFRSLAPPLRHEPAALGFAPGFSRFHFPFSIFNFQFI